MSVRGAKRKFRNEKTSKKSFFPITVYGHIEYFIWPCYSKCGSQTAAAALPESLLEMQHLGLHPRPVESESAVYYAPYIKRTLMFEKHCFIELGKSSMLQLLRH